jgi:hypothetical protein
MILKEIFFYSGCALLIYLVVFFVLSLLEAKRIIKIIDNNLDRVR